MHKKKNHFVQIDLHVNLGQDISTLVPLQIHM